MRILLVLYIFFSLEMNAQFTGTVIDQQTRYPLRDVKIEIENTATIFTDKNGEFQLPSDSVYNLVISHLGYKTTTYRTFQGNIHIIELVPDPEKINEISLISTSYNQKLKNQPGSIGLILPEEFTHNGYSNIAGIMNTQPGVYMQSGSYNTNRLVIRGIGSRNPYGTNRIKAYLNNIPLTGSDGTTVIEDLPANTIGRIEIVRGSASAIYGSGLGGTVRILSKYPLLPGYHLELNTQTGSFGTQHISLTNTYKKNMLAFRVVTGRTASDGYRTNSNYFNNHAMFNGSIFTQKFTIDVLMNYIQMQAHIPSSLNKESFLTEPSSAAENWQNIHGYEHYNKIVSGVTLTYRISDVTEHKTTFFGGYKDLYELRPFNTLKDNSKNGGLRSLLYFRFSGTQINAGVEYYAENIRWQTYENNTGTEDNIINNINELRTYLNIFLLANHKLADKLNVTIGLNINTLKYQLIESNKTDYPAGSYTYKPVISPRTGLNYELIEDMHLYGSFSHGFSSPSFEETLLPEGIRNDKLKPETGWDIDAGIRGNLLQKRFSYDVSYYSIFVKNLIVAKRITEDIFTGINAGKSYHNGLEFNITAFILNPENRINEMQVHTAFDIMTNKFIRFTDNDNDYSNNQLPGIPRYKWYIVYTWSHKKVLETNISFFKTGKQYLNDANTVKYNGYQYMNADITFSRHIFHYFTYSITLGINNIFNAHYASMILVNAPSFNGNEPRYYYPGMPRNYSVKLKLKF